MALNIEKILSHIGETKEEFSSNVDISLERLDGFMQGNDIDCLNIWMKKRKDINQ